MLSSKIKKKLAPILFIIGFISIYLVFLIYISDINSVFNVNITVFIGISFIIIAIFVFINLNHNLGNENLCSIKFLSENSIKIILLIILFVCFFLIPPISVRSVLINWTDIQLLNIIRAIVLILVCSFIPGASLYNFFFFNEKLHERLKVESFVLKLVLYPIFSFSIIGLSVLLLDYLDLHKNLFSIILLIIIVILLTLDFTIQKIRKDFRIKKIVSIEISKYSFIIVLISIGFLLISIGISIANPYLVLSDSWAGIAPCQFIGKPNVSPTLRGEKFLYYPIFWSYVIFGFSMISGIPFVNTNVLFVPFCYLFVLSIFLLMKVILSNFKSKYIVFSTIIITTFSGLFYIISDLNLSAFTHMFILYFIYKSYSFILFFISLIMFIYASKSINPKCEFKNFFKFLKSFESKCVFLSVIFLLLSYMSYPIPFPMGILFLFFYCVISENKRKNLFLLSYFFLFLVIMFIFIDIIMLFYLSYSIISMIDWFFQIQFFTIIKSFIPLYLIIYLIFISIFLLILLIRYINNKYFEIREYKILNFKINSKKTFKYTLYLFTSLLIIELFVVLLSNTILNVKLYEKYLFFNYIHILFTNIGYVGISAIYLSYFCYRKNKSLFIIMIIWILIAILIASFLFFINWINTFAIKTNSIEKENYFLMFYWFKRFWFFAVIPLSIIFSIGFINFVKYIKVKKKINKIFSNKKYRLIIRYGFFSLFVFFAFSNLFIITLRTGNINNRISKDNIEMISWTTEDLSSDSKVLMEKDEFTLKVGILFLSNSQPYFLENYISADAIYPERCEEINDLIEEKVKYFLISDEFFDDLNNRTVFVRNFLIPHFYNETLKESGKLTLYYAPFFD